VSVCKKIKKNPKGKSTKCIKTTTFKKALTKIPCHQTLN
jgi:hypothetical protein